MLAVSGEDLDALLNEVGKKVTVRRRECEMTQEQLAKRAGCSTNTVIAVENGKRNVTVRSLAMISAGLGVHFAELFPMSRVVSPQEITGVLARCSDELQAARSAIDRIQESLSKFSSKDASG
ncbi:helix-turn-helix transcriptional regulator [Acidiphilium acidophilum]|uniref:helix-turn-helix transcriptional regulator n=1 Tax=Acidiphilium acidophilum TaxID=76588 RepID=UPI0038D1E612